MALTVFGIAAAQSRAFAVGLRCLPTCDTTDGRFMAIAGSGFDTLSPPELDLTISVPAGSTTFDIGFFDGDGGEIGPGGPTDSYWDSGATALFTYSLYADPDGDGAGLVPVDLLPGSPTILSSDMPDNDWIDFTVSTGSEALTPSGNYFYVLKIQLAVPSLVTLNSFKVRTSAVLSGLTLDPVARPFSYVAPWTTLNDISVIYPNFPDATPTTYDGTFSFFFDVPVSQDALTTWDGDFDHGNYDLTDQDTDDPDTPGFPFVPAWATLDTLPEGVAIGGLGTGSPPDDGDPAEFGAYIVRSPAVRYDLFAPDGQIFSNNNPSGNKEWEQFKVSTAPFNPTQMDIHTASLPPGIYKLRINGVDMLNLNALVLPFRLLCVDEAGAPCAPLRPFTVGDTVFLDTDGNGTQGPGEPGIAGVVLNLYDASGMLVATTTTGADGHYSFPAEKASYEVRVAASNFTTGPLAGSVSTTGGESRTTTLTNGNKLDLDFGYRGTARIGDRVWNDLDGNGVQGSGEAGLNSVTVRLLDGGGNILATTTTSGDGNYSFGNLTAGTYTVSIDSATLPAGYSPTSDPDGIATPNRAAITVTAGGSVTTADFGYRAVQQPGTGTLGYWKNHPEAWPVSQITIGGVTYSKTQAINLMKVSSSGDKTYDLFKQLVAAKLNVMIGNDGSCISSTIASADSWMGSHPPGSHVSGSSSAWSMASPWHQRLDDYNNGLLCAPHRN